MRVLFCISILAMIALLWASIAIARHIQQARQRHHRELQSEAAMKSKGHP
jgi:heme exporter protein D